MSHLLHPDTSLEELNARMPGTLCGWYGIHIEAVSEGRMSLSMTIRPEMLAPNGFLHAASVVALADTTCGFAARDRLPAGSSGFTTVELKSNHMGTLLDGELCCTATPVHIGRSTQVWDARVYDPKKDRTIAVFRCTQMVLWPKPEARAAGGAGEAVEGVAEEGVAEEGASGP